MAHVPRFYVPACSEGTPSIELPEDEVHHASNVLRLDANDPVVLFNGAGSAFRGRVESTGRNAMRVRVDAMQVDPQPARRLTMLLAWLGREKSMTTAVQRGTELGVDQFVFFESAHCEPGSRKLAKLERAAIESCKQCERLWLPGFEAADDLAAAIALAEGALLLGSARDQGASFDDAMGTHAHAAVIIGPEGGLSEVEEDTAIELGAHRVSFSPFVLRSEIAVSAAAAILRQVLV